MEVSSSTLRAVPLFSELQDDALYHLASMTIWRRAAAGAVLYRIGERPKYLFVLANGQIDFGSGGDDDFATIEVLRRPGECFVLPTVLLNRPYVTQARAHTDAELICIPASSLRDFLKSDPKLASIMLAALAQQNRMLMREIGELKRRTAAQRLGCFLLGLAEEQCQRGGRRQADDFAAGPGVAASSEHSGREDLAQMAGHPRQIVLPYDKRLLASRLGMTPEHLSRAFASLRRHGVNTGHGRIVILNNPAALTAFARHDPIDEVAASLPADDERQHN